MLASASPRRVELLARIGVIPDAIVPAEIDESPAPREAVRAYALRMAREKAAAVAANEPQSLVLAADTVVSAGRRILGKPVDEAEARAFLTLLSGRRHVVSTAICLRRGGRHRETLVATKVRFRVLTRAEIEAYLASGEWQGKAGGYAIQGRAAAFAPWLQGSVTGVIGLPLAETAVLLAAAGIRGTA